MNEYVIYYHEIGRLEDGMFVWYFDFVAENIPQLLEAFELYKGKEAIENIIQIIVKNKLH